MNSIFNAFFLFLLLLFPLGYSRIPILSPLTLFDVFLYLIFGFLFLISAGRILIKPYKEYNYFLKIYSLFGFFLLLNPLFNLNSYIEEAKLIAVFLLNAFSLYVISIAISRLGLKKTFIYLTYGTVFFSLLTVLAVLLGFAKLSGSGRAIFIFGTSNGLANFMMTAYTCTFSLFYIKRIDSVFLNKKIILLCMFIIIFGVFFSGSRGALVYVVFLPLIASIFLDKLSVTKVFFIIVISFILLFFFQDALELLNGILVYFFNLTNISAFDRLSEFISLLISGGVSDLDELDESRNQTNKIILELLFNDFSIFGRGLETSMSSNIYGIKPHNFVLYVWFEMGVLNLVLFLSVFTYILFKAFLSRFKNKNESANVSILLVVTILYQAMKTPFLLQNLSVWILLLFALIFTNQDECVDNK